MKQGQLPEGAGARKSGATAKSGEGCESSREPCPVKTVGCDARARASCRNGLLAHLLKAAGQVSSAGRLALFSSGCDAVKGGILPECIPGFARTQSTCSLPSLPPAHAAPEDMTQGYGGATGGTPAGSPTSQVAKEVRRQGGLVQ